MSQSSGVDAYYSDINMKTLLITHIHPLPKLVRTVHCSSLSLEVADHSTHKPSHQILPQAYQEG